MSLTVTQITAARPAARPYKMADGGGLYLLVTPSASKLWRLDYRHHERRLTLALGSFPDLKLADARERRDDAKKALRRGLDPAETLGTRRRRIIEAARPTFADLAERWFQARKRRWCEGYALRIWNRIAQDIIPVLGERPPAEITSEEILAALRGIEARGSIETARRVRTYVENIFKFAKAERSVAVNPAEDLVEALQTPPPPKRRAALKARDLPTFLEDLAHYDGEARTRLALEFTLLTFVRTSEVRLAEWSEFEDLRGPEPLWRIPAARMKMRNEHLVPLAPQTVKLLLRLKSLAGASTYVFPAEPPSGVMSENTMIYALYRMGYHSRATVHGFRGTASTVLNEKGFNSDWIERQLAHVDSDEVRSAYNSAQWLSQRRGMMIWWASYLDHQRALGCHVEASSYAAANDDWRQNILS